MIWIKIDDYTINGQRFIILGDKETNGKEYCKMIWISK